MRQFFAILKDSYREAVDGFVIYVMLGLAALVVVLLGSLSFTPAEPDEAFPVIVSSFDDVTVMGQTVHNYLSQYTSFQVERVQPAGGGYAVRLVATGTPFVPGAGGRGQVVEEAAQPEDGPAPRPNPPPAAAPAGVDGFRRLVAIWVRENKGRNEIPVFRAVNVTEDEARAVTDAQMEDFVRTQFAFHASMDATVTRAKGEADGPEYRFDAATAGGSAVRGWPHKVKAFFGAMTFPMPLNLGETLFVIQDTLVSGVGAALALLIGVVVTAFFIPNMLRKGSVDLLIAKPIGRAQLLVYKYVGGLTFIFLVTAATVGGSWLVLAARSGIWDPSFLVVIPVLTFAFAILYAVSTAVGVFTRSPIVSILLTVGFMLFLVIVGKVKSFFDIVRADERMRKDLPEWSFLLVDGLNNVLPRYKDLDKLTTKLLSGSLTPAETRARALDLLAYPSWGETVGVSLLFIAVMLAASCWRFSRRDY